MDHYSHPSVEPEIFVCYEHFSNQLDIQLVLLLNFQLFVPLAESNYSWTVACNVYNVNLTYFWFLLKREIDVSKPCFNSFRFRMNSRQIIHFSIKFDIVSILLEVCRPVSKFFRVQTFEIIPGFNSIIFSSGK